MNVKAQSRFHQTVEFTRRGGLFFILRFFSGLFIFIISFFQVLLGWFQGSVLLGCVDLVAFVSVVCMWEFVSESFCLSPHACCCLIRYERSHIFKSASSLLMESFQLLQIIRVVSRCRLGLKLICLCSLCLCLLPT